MNAKRAMYESWKKLYTEVAGPKTESNFQKTGTLTHKEFLEAGDALVQKVPVWEWQAGQADVLPYLPTNKKYLIQRGVTCFERADQDVDDDVAVDDDDWVATHPNYVPKSKASVTEKKPMDWSKDEDEDALGDDDLVQAKPCRMYDVYLVFDDFYQTPRFFLLGYSEKDHCSVLTRDEMMQDVYCANREKTVSIDPHPFIKAPCISIHPCRHAETMKVMLTHIKDKLESAQDEIPEAERVPFLFPTFLSFFIFLKFISSVVPTIRYDVSFELDM